MFTNNLPRTLIACLLVVVLAAGCAPGNARWSTDTGRPANFWAGLWHGIIIVVTFVVSLFSMNVEFPGQRHPAMFWFILALAFGSIALVRVVFRWKKW